MSFSLSPWFLIPFLAAGLWLAYRLYFARAVSSRWRWILGGTTLLAWLLLAGLVLQPLWADARILYHAPAVILAVDESPSYAGGATLHSEEALRKSTAQVRKYYKDRGFRVLDFVFGERVLAANAMEEADEKMNVGALTRIETLRHHLDSLMVPNLQGIFLWTDGRANGDSGSQDGAWPSPVFSVSLPPGKLAEVQGEKVEVNFSNPDSGTEVNVEWRPVGVDAKTASVELRSGSQVLWKSALPGEPYSGSRLRHRFQLGAGVLRGGEEKWTALIRPDRKTDNAFEANDTVELRLRGLHRSPQIFPRPLRSLAERGLVDALFASDSTEVRVVSPGSLEENLRDGAILWTHEMTQQQALVAKKSGSPVIVYSFPEEASPNKTASFTSAARVTWREDIAPFLPGEVLSLADLGVSNVDLPPAGPAAEAIAWAEEGNRRGLLLSRRKADSNTFEFHAPPVWSAVFRPGSEERIRKLQHAWVQGVAEWARFQNNPARISAKPAAPRDPMAVEMSRLGEDVEKLSALALAAKGSMLQATPSGELPAASFPNLPAGQSEETLSNSHALFPVLPVSWIIAALLCFAWALRKKIHLD